MPCCPPDRFGRLQQVEARLIHLVLSSRLERDGQIKTNFSCRRLIVLGQSTTVFVPAEISEVAAKQTGLEMA